MMDSYISSATFVATFDRDELIRYKLEELKVAFKDLLPESFAETDVIDASAPAIFRFIARTDSQQLAVSQIGAELKVNFYEHRPHPAQGMHDVEQLAVAFWRGICRLKGVAARGYCGVIITVNQPRSEAPEQLAEDLMRRYLKMPIVGTPAHVRISYGYRGDAEGLYESHSVGVYQLMREVALDSGPPSSPLYEVDLDEIEETGVELKYDFNTLLAREEGRPSSDEDMLIVLRKLALVLKTADVELSDPTD